MTAPQPSGPASAKWDAVALSPDDHVAVAVREIEGGVNVLVGGKIVRRTLASPIPMGHKFALSELPAGTEIRKYGEVIGILTQAVAAGDHVHIHNLASRRARAR